MNENANRQISSTLQWSFFTVLLGFLVFFLILVLIWLLIDLLTPVLVGLLLAFIFSPLVNWTNRKWRFPPWLTVTLLLLLLAAVTAALAIYLVPLFLQQASEFLQKVPDYIESLMESISGQDITLDQEIRSRFSDAAAEHNILPIILRGTVKSIGLISKAFGAASYFLLYAILLVVFFVAFSLYLPAVKMWCLQFLPHSRRDRIIAVLAKIYDASGAFLRTRLIIAFILCVVFSAGWAFAGVPYWLLLGTATGILNIIPFAAAIGWFAAMLVNSLEADSFNALLYALLWPTVVFIIGQFLDGWLLTPLLQAKKLRINGVILLLAVFAGGALAGLLGMLLAIPFVAAWQILFSELIKPPFIKWAQTH